MPSDGALLAKSHRTTLPAMSLVEIKHSTPAPIGKPTRPPRVKGKLVEACRAIVRQGQSLDEAARTAGLTTRSVRLALEKPHVIAFLKAEREVFRAYISAQNIHRAAEIRDSAGNAMARLGAIKVIEQLGDDNAGGSSTSRAPGVMIVIGAPAVSVTAHERTIEPKPLIVQGSVSHRGENEG